MAHDPLQLYFVRIACADEFLTTDVHRFLHREMIKFREFDILLAEDKLIYLQSCVDWNHSNSLNDLETLFLSEYDNQNRDFYVDAVMRGHILATRDRNFSAARLVIINSLLRVCKLEHDSQIRKGLIEGTKMACEHGMLSQSAVNMIERGY